MITKNERRLKIKSRVRGKINGTPEVPRLSVFRSNKQIYAQVIDDTNGKTLASASSLKIVDKLPKKEIAANVNVRPPFVTLVVRLIATKRSFNSISFVVFTLFSLAIIVKI